MKKGIHPVTRPTVFIDVSTNDQIITTSTLTTEETIDVAGVTYQVVRSDITSFSHPFFTGEMRFVDQKGRVDGFLKKMELAKAKQEALAKKAKGKKPEEAGEAKSYRDVLKDQQDALRKTKAPTQA